MQWLRLEGGIFFAVHHPFLLSKNKCLICIIQKNKIKV
ncbi:hypothetical protein BTHERMOSOX_616 [Bathymodiolus thermophilus thioautotrophic gill symbiont]|nr:hypothetical protein THERMOT_1239 [Bathymodiolus thermophilus thioautotrophic gill symbiont]SGZ73037.1 hypothetical protein BTHERMOSOX_616 [Bathymodiolus thermophilus thioautotrophic gill symbiont]